MNSINKCFHSTPVFGVPRGKGLETGEAGSGKVHQDARSLVVKYSNPDYSYNGMKIPAVNVSASRDSVGVVHISLVNLDAVKAIMVRMAVEDLISKTVTGRILTSERFTDINTFGEAGKVKVGVFDGVRKEGGELVVRCRRRVWWSWR